LPFRFEAALAPIVLIIAVLGSIVTADVGVPIVIPVQVIFEDPKIILLTTLPVLDEILVIKIIFWLFVSKVPASTLMEVAAHASVS
jgi:hypothetical protein